MSIADEKSKYPNLRQATLSFLIKDGEVLLALKKRGFGVGKWNGTGGKPNDNEIIEDTARREVKEEIGVEVKNIIKMGIVDFYFENKPEWSQQVVVYIVDIWDGVPTETEEMAPKWFKFEDVPYDQMWEDDQYWLPQVIRGKQVEASFLFNEKQELIEKEIK